MITDLTIILPRLIGTYCLVMFLSMLRRDLMLEAFRELSSHRAISYILGVLMILMGLAIVIINPGFGNLASIVITIIGWEILILSFIFLFSTKETLAAYINKLDNKTVYYSVSIGYLIVGIYLFSVGFSA